MTASTAGAVALEATLMPSPDDCDVPLDAILALLRDGDVREAMARLNGTLTAARRIATPQTWSRIMEAARKHAVREIVHRDPFTFRCFAKPRGYAGDAGALDYVLRRRDLVVRAKDPLADLHHYTTHGALARALAHRCDESAAAAEEAARHGREPIRIFLACCGALRECDRMASLGAGRIAQLVAFDVDAFNLEGARKDYPGAPLVTHLGSVRQLIEGRHLFGDMDVVACGALLDTIQFTQAPELLRALFAMLKPGGTLVASNLLESLPEIGYIETYMDWRMTYRTREFLEALAATLPGDSVETVTYRENGEKTIGSLTIRRRP